MKEIIVLCYLYNIMLVILPMLWHQYQVHQFHFI